MTNIQLSGTETVLEKGKNHVSTIQYGVEVHQRFRAPGLSHEPKRGGLATLLHCYTCYIRLLVLRLVSVI